MKNLFNINSTIENIKQKICTKAEPVPRYEKCVRFFKNNMLKISKNFTGRRKILASIKFVSSKEDVQELRNKIWAE